MQFEHFALNVPDAAAMAAWYVKHLDMQAVRSIFVYSWTARSPYSLIPNQ